MPSTLDQSFMQRAIDLALLGRGKTKSNPIVGSVLIKDQEIIAEGWHEKFGEAHAEVNCLKDFKPVEGDSEDSFTLYVTLEPCSHFGKTPPCVDLVLAKGIQRVVIGMVDPNPKVAGKSIEKLKQAGVEVEVGVLEEACKEINRPFIVNQKFGRPYLLLKWAQTADGYLARSNFDSKWISSKLSRIEVHKHRSFVDGILVGKNTALHDNPSLTTRHWKGDNPTRIVLDKNLDVPASHSVMDGTVSTIIVNQNIEKEEGKVKYIKFDYELFDLSELLEELYLQGIASIMVEGGATTLSQFLEKNLWDEIMLFESKKLFGNGIKGPSVPFAVHEERAIEEDALKIYRNGAWL